MSEVVELEDADGRGRNGPFKAVCASVTNVRDKVLLEIESRRTNDQAPIQLLASGRDTARLAAALLDATGFVPTKSASSADVACQGLDPRALEALGPGGLSEILSRLETAYKTGQIIVTGRGTLEAVSRLWPLIPAQARETSTKA